MTDEDLPIDPYWMLTITVAGAHFRDTIQVQDEDVAGLEPQIISRGKIEFERYGSIEEDGWVEVRLDHVVSRRMERVQPVVRKPSVDEAEFLEQPAELRIQQRPGEENR